MDNWRSLVAVLVFFALLEIYHGFPFNVNSETRTPDNWQDESLDSAAVSKMADMMKRSKALRFYGLMGKRSGSRQPIQMNRRRNKGEMFVGLMGRSITSGESLTQILPGASRAIGCVQGVP
uniref:Si:ch211-131k2.2 n=1 Tax=Gadus morhua TaxID=8049 RepID=A0A8C5FQG4_GADMO